MHIAFARPPLAETGGDNGYIDGIAPALRELGHKVDVVEDASTEFAEGAVPVIEAMAMPRLATPMEELAGRDAVALVHHVAAGSGPDDPARPELKEVERAMLQRLRRVVATSGPVAARLQSEFGVAAQQVPPGVPDLPRNQPGTDAAVVLSVGVLTRRKGHDVLLRAMARLTDLPWTLAIAGGSGRDPAYAAELAALIEELGLSHRASLLADPEPDALRRAWESAGVFALATRWESYAKAVAEALRRGIPVVVTDGGEAGALVPAEAGAVCSVDDPATFGKCLRRLLFDHALRADMAEAAWQAGQQLPSWRQQAQAFAAILRS